MDDNSSHKGKRNQSYSMAFKRKVIAYAKKENNNTKAAREFRIDKKRVIEWRKKEDEILKEEVLLKKRLPGAGRKVFYTNIEESLLKWISNRRELGARVTGKSLKAECRRLHRENGAQGFKASCGWLRRFMKRHNMSFRRATHTAQQKPTQLNDKMQSFLRYVTRMRRLRNYNLQHIGNMDETPIWIDMPGEYTIEERGVKTVHMGTTGHEKTRVTVMLGAMADGTKLPPVVLLKGVRPPKEVPNGIIIKMTPSSWANEEIMMFWLKMVWRKDNTNKRLLVWDSFRGHITPKVKEAVSKLYNSDMAVIPGGTTCKLQPCDVSWNRPFKDHFRDLYDEWLVDGTVELTRGGNRKAPDRTLFLKWIKQAWASVSPELIRKSFRVTGLSLATDGTEDDQLFRVDDDDEDPFEGFTTEETGYAENFFQAALDGGEHDSPSEMSASDDDCSDPDSPGH